MDGRGGAVRWPASGWLQEAARAVAGGPEVLGLLARAGEPAIAHHSARVFRYAHALGGAEGAGARELDDGTLFLACLLHDLGATAPGEGSRRFEVEGADRAADFARAHGYSTEQAGRVGEAVALHTSPHIAERIHPLARWVRLGVLADFGTPLVEPGLRRQVEGELPRLEVERRLSRLVVEQALRDERRAPAGSWSAALLAAHRDGDDPDSRLAAF